MEKLTGLELANQMGDFVNTFNRDKGKEFIDGFCRQHRTLQQSSFRMMLELIEHMASDNYHTDGRNEDSHKITKWLIDGFKEAKKKEYLAEGVTEQRATEYVSGEWGSKPSKYLGSI